MTTERMNHADRLAQLTQVAVKLATKQGYQAVTRDQVAKEGKVSPCLVSRYFNDMDGMRDAIVVHAAEAGNVKIIAEALVHRHPAVRKVRDKHKDAVISLLFK